MIKVYSMMLREQVLVPAKLCGSRQGSETGTARLQRDENA